MISGRPDPRPILITGGAGYIGSALVSRLLGEGRAVRVFDPLFYGDSALSAFRGHPHFSLTSGDPTDVDVVTEAVRGTDRIVHLGAIVGDPACALDPAFTRAANVEATRILAKAAGDCAVRRFIFASTCSVYGAGDALLDEQASLAPRSIYAESKVEAERLVLASAKLEPVVLRFGTIFGASRRPRFDLVVNLLAAKAALGDPITINGGDQWRPFVHVEDVVSAIVLALDADSSLVSSEIFNVGAEKQNHRLAELGEILMNLVPASHVRIDQASGDPRNYRANFSKIATRLGFEARWPLRNGIEEMVHWVTKHRNIDYRAAEFSNDRALVERAGDSTGLSFERRCS